MSKINENDILSTGQLGSIIISAIIGAGILSLSRVVSEVSGRDGWISVIIGGLFAILNTYIVIKLAKRYPNETIIEYSNKIVGKYLSKVIGILFLLFYIGSSSIILRMLAEILITWFLRYTPRTIISLLIVLLCVYGSRKGIKVLGRVSYILVFLLFPLIILLIVPFFVESSIMNIRPVGREGINIIKGVLPSIFSYSGFELILLYFPFLTNKKKIVKAGIYPVIGITILYSTIVFLQFITFPQVTIKKMWMPSIQYIASLKVPFFERIDLLFINTWLIAIFTTIFTQYYSIGVVIKDLFNLKSRKNVPIIVAPIVFFISIIPNNIVETNKYGEIISYASILLAIILPTLLLIISNFKKRGDINE